MSKNSKAHKRGSSRTRRAHSRRRRTHRRRGGADALDGAPLKYSLAGSWPSRMSLGQGADYFKYHVGQHGGESNIGGAPLRAISHSTLPADLRTAAHINGIDNAIEYSRQFKDPNQSGGRRSRRCKKHGKRHGKKQCKSYCKSRRHRHHGGRRTHRKRGGNMGYAPFPNKGMLLDSASAYSQAGLNPQWKTDPAFDAAEVRSQQ
jgi:hypothetical protein